MQFLIVLIVFLCNFHRISSVRIPENPCPSVFSYKNENNLFYGEVEIPYDGQMILNFTIKVSILGIHGDLALKLTLLNDLDDLKTGSVLKYRIDFPLQDNLPKITKILYNNREYCSGPGEPVSPEGVTNLWQTLRHFIIEYPVRIGGDLSKITTTIKPITNNFNTILKETTPIDTTTEFIQRVANNNNNNNENNLKNYCGIANDIQSLIINGELTSDNEFPWLVGLFRRNGVSYDFQCTANLITNRHIITAAHCVQFYNSPLIKIDDMLLVMGRSNLTHWAISPKTILRTAKSINVHPDYRQYTAHGDLVIIELNQPIIPRKEIHPICLWTDTTRNFNGGNGDGIVAGWGKDENGKETVPQPHKVHMPIVSQEECLRSNSAYYNLTSEMTFCAGKRNNQGPCTGDSGAGFIVKYQNRWYLKGLVSIAIKQSNSFNCDLSQYVIFVDIFKFMNWINSVINNNTKPNV